MRKWWEMMRIGRFRGLGIIERLDVKEMGKWGDQLGMKVKIKIKD